jgi:transcriptional regulator with XRE-family HTH domain
MQEENTLEPEDQELAEAKALAADLQKEFGKRIHFLRRHLDITQEQLAEMIHMSVNMVSMIETGHAAPSFLTLGRLTKALNVKVIDLFRFDKSIPWKQDAPDADDE